jgi:hypothetical protein
MSENDFLGSVLLRMARFAFFVGMLAAVPAGVAATIWTGPLFTYNQPSADPTQASNQDRITPDVWLTRAASKGLFNAFAETNATTFSPTNTEWALGTLTNYSSLHYTNWLAWLNGASPSTLIGQPAVVHLIADDIYVSVQFTVWVPGGSGGFAYQRSTPALVSLAGASIQNGQLRFNYIADAGFIYVVQSSTNLLDWVAVATNVAPGNPVQFSDTINPINNRFYRVGRWPNP